MVFLSELRIFWNLAEFVFHKCCNKKCFTNYFKLVYFVQRINRRKREDPSSSLLQVFEIRLLQITSFTNYFKLVLFFSPHFVSIRFSIRIRYVVQVFLLKKKLKMVFSSNSEFFETRLKSYFTNVVKIRLLQIISN